MTRRPHWTYVVWCVGAWAFLISESNYTKASTLEYVRAVNAAIDYKSDHVSAQDRAKLARQFLNYWKSFADRVPRLSPAESSYVDGERNSASAERFMAMANSREFSLWYLLDRANFCVKSYTYLTAADQPDRIEAYLWAKSQTCYRNSGEVASHLTRAGLSKGYDGAFNISMFGMWEAFTIDVLVGSVLFPKTQEK